MQDDSITQTSDQAGQEPVRPPSPKSQSYGRLVWRQFKRNRAAVASLWVLAALSVIAVFAPFLANDVPIYLVRGGETYWFPNVITYDDLQAQNAYRRFKDWKPGPGESAILPLIPFSPTNQFILESKEPPSARHWLGTDDRGRDVLARMIWGTRVSLSVGFVAVGIALAIGIVLGALAGFYGGWADAVVLRIIEVFMVVPTFFVIIAAMAFLPPSIYNIMVVIGLFSWTGIARLVRGEFLKLRSSEYALAAQATGLSNSRIIFRHLLPNALGPVWVSATFGVAGAILTESGLSFLGFGIQPPDPSWGELLKQAQKLVAAGAWWLVVFPGLAIFITVTAFNLVGQGLRDAMDPYSRQ